MNTWQLEKSKAIAFPALKCKSRLNFRVRGQFEINILKVRLMNTTYFICILKKLNLSLRSFEKQQLFKSAAHEHDLFYIHFKKIELEPAIIWKVATCQRIPSKNTRTQWVDTWARDTGQQKHYFDSCQLIKTCMYNIRLQAPKLARKCEIKHWYACGAEGRKVGWSVYDHVITEFSRMDRFSKLWCFELSPWSNKI